MKNIYWKNVGFIGVVIGLALGAVYGFFYSELFKKFFTLFVLGFCWVLSVAVAVDFFVYTIQKAPKISTLNKLNWQLGFIAMILLVVYYLWK